MRFWIRELAGWLLIATGMGIFYVCFLLLLNHYVLEAGPLALIGIFVFRGGIHLLKIAVAARICLQARELPGDEPARPTPQGAASRTRPPLPPQRPR